MAKMTIEVALKRIKNLEKQIDKLKITNGCLKRSITNTQINKEEAKQIISAVKTIIRAVKIRYGD